MKSILFNIGYFIKEAKTLFKINLLSNVFTIFSTGLILFILSMVISGWWISNEVVRVIEKESEINIYYDEGIVKDDALKLAEEIKGHEGVLEARIVKKEEALKRMEEILGKEAQVLEFFEDNPFSGFIEAKIDLNTIDSVIEDVEEMYGITYIRDNREVLDRLYSISKILRILGVIVVVAVGITTLFIISHIIRLGIYNNREEIRTLRLLGAPEGFIATPFLLEGVLLTIGGGALAIILSNLTLEHLFTMMVGPLPFIPLPPVESLKTGLVIITTLLSIFLGIAGGIFGLVSSKVK
ncbi:FtsX-like permease family protein [Alkaliphilus pronyensis]|uniref:Cell division protein FtsX n=1 Tax=Alkaliphilus pronyensis TaxID=1482732 RepID=A0A6I0FDR8_9FIRM|nr:permease-like cell division protein FtsX [Alkaliphilus pronyensis]KAB3536045.1 FtsX-like permease family protein [Alkaliphilus pronyensis]